MLFIQRTERKLQDNSFCRRKKSGRRVLPVLRSTRNRVFHLILRFFLPLRFDSLLSQTEPNQNQLLAANWIFATVNRRITDASLHCQRLAFPNSATDRGGWYLPQRRLFSLLLYRINVSISHPVCFGYIFYITALFLRGEFIIRGVPHMWCLYSDVRAPSNFKCMTDCSVR
jgi:hypothetical protein